ncbi:histone-lysine n-methyltransferase, suv9 [Aspergillus sclerotiicarbonarius CBS 121057]|uniref:Histone-lysine n-methyltransferase, suv9 n=1 Tax=Aspergillus sclerotiicarbonarius (strain CBS 121057 / IBT 28362) TaxID=1448318 RepID=A0A319ESU6_ASPSB|nr:histone-lysine n-methyltransferase, suv9 [Aspergillus sclerotiicarbonarius CBS 121057]
MVIDLTQDSDSGDRTEEDVPSPSGQLQSAVAAASHQPSSSPSALQHKSSFFSTLAHRTASSVPSKRKSEDVDALLAAFQAPRPHSLQRSLSQPQQSNNLTKQPQNRHISHSQDGPKKAMHIQHPLMSTRRSSPFNVTATRQLHHNHGLNEEEKHFLIKKPSFKYTTPSPGPTFPPSSLSVVVPSPSQRQRLELASADLIPAPSPIGLSEAFYPTDAYEKRAVKGAYPVARKVRRAEIPFEVGTVGPLLTSKPNINAQLRQTLQRKLGKIRGPTVTFASGDEHLLAQFAANFEFVNAYKIRQGVTPVSEEFNAGCTCNGVCDPARCLCLSKEEETNDSMVPYKRAEDDARLLVLTPEFLKRKAMIYECSSRCGCDERCWNRVVQSGRTVRLEIFNTGNRGFGLRSPDRIRAGQFIDCYLGEAITKEVADVREDIATSQNAHSYLFSLDFLIAEEDSKYVVDGHKFGGPTRFMNHSCNPNCRMFPVSRNHADEYLYDLAFFALKDVPPMTELTFDYNPGWEAVKKVDPNAVQCLCGESNCRGQLWPNQRKAKGMK